MDKILQEVLGKLDKRVGVVESLFNGIRLPTSWNFILPAYFKKIIMPSIPTDAEGDHFVFPHCAGAPTGTPKTAGAAVWDSTNDKLYVWDGGAWRSVTLT